MALSAANNQRADVKPSVRAKPEKGKSYNLRDSAEINATTAVVDLWPANPSTDRLRANYVKNPFGTATTVHRVSQIGFDLNVGVIRVTGADAAATTTNVQALINAFHSASFEIGTDAGCSVEGEHRFMDYAAFEFGEVVASAATVHLVQLIRRELVALPEAIAIEPGAGFRTRVTFRTPAGLPATGTVGGAPDGKLMLVQTLNASAYANSIRQQVRDELREKARLNAGTAADVAA